jgi:alkanesulfonate monooxygenase SsuD/methylene tetrahydromethanopterin reductase-like flavin-dependent oxidoreductase (luciferase family)
MPDRRGTADTLATNLIEKMGNLDMQAAGSPVATTEPVAYAGRRSGGLKLGFLTNVPFTGEESGAAHGLAEAIETFKYAESVGFDSGWVRQRHFDNYISSPLVLLAAIAQHTSRIRLGTGVMTVSYEDPIRLTEDASTVDLLSGGRLELGMAAGNTRFDAVFGGERLEGREEGHDRIRRFREALAGNTLPIRDPNATADLPEFRARPRSPELDQRLWYGSGSAESAARTGSLGLGLLLSTLNHNPTSDSFEEAQRDNIVAYLDSFEHPVNQPRVCLSRLFMPAVNERQRQRYAEFDRIRRAEGPAGPRPQGALEPKTLLRTMNRDRSVGTQANGLPSDIQLCQIYHGDPDGVLEAAHADAGLDLADEMMIWLPPNFTLDENKELLENIVKYIAEPLGWRPAAS